MNRKKMFVINTVWHVYNPAKKTFEKAEIAGNLIAIKQAGSYKWLVAENPFPTDDCILAQRDRKFMVAEKGTGYVLAYGPTAQIAYDRAVMRFKGERSDSIKAADIRLLLQYQLNLLANFIPASDFKGIKPDLSGFQVVIPAPTLHRNRQ